MMCRPFVAGFVCLALFGQIPQVPTFQTQTNLVIVNVTVRDKSGKLIENLKKEEFTLLEDNRPQNISVFEVEHLNSTALPPVDSARATISAPRRDTAAVSEPVSRRDRRLLALYFDLSSMQPQEQIRAQQAALKFLNQQMTASDLVSILMYSNRLRVVQDFTDNRDLLLSEIQGFRIGEASENAVDGATGPDPTDDSGAFTPDETEFNIFNTDLKLIGLEEAAKKLAVYPEKKALIYFSSGISRTGVDNESQLRATVNAAVRANVAFYPVLVQASSPAARNKGCEINLIPRKRPCPRWLPIRGVKRCSIPTI
jgi:VWFA-related protein